MAMTATVEMAPGPSWDQKIVPTLRKRLETESKLLAKRMSAASITSEDTPPQSSTFNPNQTTTIQTYYHHQPRPSAIPRPSTQSRPSDSGNRPTQPPFTRTRTLSQPFPFDPDTADRSAASPSPTSAQPLSGVSRIPVKARTGSVSTSTHSTPRIDGRISKDTYYAADAIGPRSKVSALVNEQPPFTSDTDADSVRFSSESEERPFEHWYRGDVSRNGGVGEFRVVRRKEMLDIASYGHSTKKQISSRSASRFGVHTELVSPRRRAGSIGVDTRSSFYMEEPRSKDDLVLDEVPPSAIAYSDPEIEDDHESEMDYYFSSHATAISPPPASVESEPQEITTTPRIPTPSQKRPSRDDAQTTRSAITPEPVRGSSDSPSTSSSAPPRTPTPRTRSQTPTKTVGNQTPKRKSKSPGPDRSPRSNGTAKKAKTTPKSPPSAHKIRKAEDSRRSVGVYPVTELEDAEHAIPTWIQPVASSNWDEVVLPVVARKKGLDGQYQATDGSPKPRKPEPRSPEPAPGTFGYDYSKYRPPRDGELAANGIELDDFGIRKPAVDTESTVEEKVKEGPPSTVTTTIEDDRPISTTKQNDYNHRPSPPPSPAPFSHYTPQGPLGSKPLPSQAPPPVEEDDHSGGCCKCVIM